MKVSLAVSVLLASMALGTTCAHVPQAPAEAPAPALFLPVKDSELPPDDTELRIFPNAVIRQRLVRLNPAVIHSGVLPASTERVRLNLFQNTSYTAVRSPTETQAGDTEASASDLGVVIWDATIEELPTGEDNQVTIDSRDGFLMATISAGERYFQIEPAGELQARIVEVDLSKYPPDEAPGGADCKPVLCGSEGLAAGAAPSMPPEAAARERVAPDAVPTVRVLVVYNGERSRDAKTNNPLRAAIAEHHINRSFWRQRIRARVSIVGVKWVDHKTKDNSTKDLAWAMHNQHIQKLRDHCRADVVTLWTGGVKNGHCGLAGYWGQLPKPACAPRAYAVVDRACVLSTKAFAHELGHLLGLQHDHYSLEQGCHYSSFPSVPCSYGFTNPELCLSTMMSEDSRCDTGGRAQRVLVWSTPEALGEYPPGTWGVACGSPSTAANSAEQIGPGAEVVARYR